MGEALPFTKSIVGIDTNHSRVWIPYNRHGAGDIPLRHRHVLVGIEQLLCREMHNVPRLVGPGAVGGTFHKLTQQIVYEYQIGVMDKGESSNDGGGKDNGE